MRPGIFRYCSIVSALHYYLWIWVMSYSSWMTTAGTEPKMSSANMPMLILDSARDFGAPPHQVGGGNTFPVWPAARRQEQSRREGGAGLFFVAWKALP